MENLNINGKWKIYKTTVNVTFKKSMEKGNLENQRKTEDWKINEKRKIRKITENVSLKIYGEKKIKSQRKIEDLKISLRNRNYIWILKGVTRNLC